MNKLCCPYDPNSYLLEDRGDLICTECGLVVAQYLEDLEYYYNNSVPNISGKEIKNFNKKIVDHLFDIEEAISRLNVSEIVKKLTKELFIKIYDSKLIRGRSYSTISAACIYISCKQNHSPRTFKEICSVTGISKKEIARNYTYIIKKFNIRNETACAMDYVVRFCNYLDLSTKQKQTITKIISQFEHKGKSPISISAAAIYFVGRENIKDLCLLTGVSETTIKNLCKAIKNI